MTGDAATTRARRPIIAWAFYDWANSAYATTVMAGFFPIFFKQYSSVDTAATVTTFRLGLANTCAGFIVALLAPVLGAIADRGGVRKRFLISFAVFGATMTAALSTLARGAWQEAWLLYVAGTIGFIGANVFYDSLIIDVAPPARYEAVSALGFGLGYLGGGLLFTLDVAMTLKPQWFGLADVTAAVRWSFLTVALWWVVFSVPLLLWVRERKVARGTARAAQSLTACGSSTSPSSSCERCATWRYSCWHTGCTSMAWTPSLRWQWTTGCP